MDDTKKAEEALKQEIKNYSKLERINKSEEFNDFFTLQVDVVAQKMVACFAGTGPKDWEEFQRIRGEIVGILYPIQQVRGAKYIVDDLNTRLNAYYNEQG